MNDACERDEANWMSCPLCNAEINYDDWEVVDDDPEACRCPECKGVVDTSDLFA